MLLYGQTMKLNTANPFYPFTGDGLGNAAAINTYGMFAKYMNADYKPLPSSIIAEGEGTWTGAGDRGDAAMIAYGASRFALSYGNADTAVVMAADRVVPGILQKKTYSRWRSSFR